MALSEAEKRRRRFLKEKNKFNSFNELVKHHKNRDQTVWFDLEGNILQISAEQKRKKSVKERSVVFTAEQLEILKDKDVDSNIATANGKKVLKFYFTSKNDPHFMIKSVNVLLSDLLENKSVTKKLTKNLDQCSIYTIKLFDKYVCI